MKPNLETRIRVWLLLAIMGLVAAPVSGGAGLAPSGTMAFHQLTQLTSAPGCLGQPVLSGSGTRAVFAAGAPGRVFSMEVEGSNPLELISLTNATNLALDLDYFGSTVVASDGRVVRLLSGGAPRELLALAEQEIIGCRVSGGGGVVLLLVGRNTLLRETTTPVSRGVHLMRSDGTGFKQVVTAGQVAALVGGTPDDILGFGLAGPGLALASDNSRVVFGATHRAAGQVLFGANYDGSDLRVILSQTAPAQLAAVAVSADGGQVAYALGGSSPSVGIVRFDGTERRTLWTPASDMELSAAANGLQLNGDGTRLLAGATGLLLSTDGSGARQLSVPVRASSASLPGLIQGGLPRVSMSRRGDRFLHVSTNASGVVELVLLELDPLRLGGAPALVGASVNPESLSAGGASSAAISVGVPPGSRVEGARVVALRAGLADAGMTSPLLHDDGANGDARAGDLVFSDNGLAAAATAPAGPRILRFQAEALGTDGRRHATAVDFEGFFVVRGGGGPSPLVPVLASLNPDRGEVGDRVVLRGTNFDADPGGNLVLFGSRAAPVLSGSVGELVVLVPQGLVAGPTQVSVTVGGRRSNPLNFNVLAPRLEVPNAPVDFGAVSVGQTTNRSFAVRNAGSAPLNVTRFSLTNSVFRGLSPPGPFTLAPGAGQTFTIAFTPTNYGSFTGTLLIASEDPTLPLAEVSLGGVGLAPDIEVSPRSLSFAPSGTDDYQDQVVNIRNQGNATLTVDSAPTSNPRFRATWPPRPFDIAPGATTPLTIRFSPCTETAERGSLQIRSNDADEPTVPVSLAGAGQSSTNLVVTLNGRGRQSFQWDDGAGWVQTVEMNVDVTLQIFPASPLRENNVFHSYKADFRGSIHLWGNASDYFLNEDRNYTFNFEQQVSADQMPFHTLFASEDGRLVWAEASLASFWKSDVTSAYYLVYDASTSQVDFWIEIPGRWNFPDRPSEDEKYGFDARACVSGVHSDVKGIVRDASNGQPLPGARVSLGSVGTTVTGADGSFRFASVPVGDYTVDISREEYAPIKSRLTATPFVVPTMDISLPLLAIKSIDYRIEENKRDHRTFRFTGRGELIVRRGATFSVDVQLPNPLPDAYTLSFEGIVPDGSRPPKSIRIPVEEGNPNSGVWGARIVSGHGTDHVRLEIVVPGNAAVGEYQFKASIVDIRTARSVYAYPEVQNAVILFNAWSGNDEVFMPSEQFSETARFAYTLEDWMLLYLGGPHTLAADVLGQQGIPVQQRRCADWQADIFKASTWEVLLAGLRELALNERKSAVAVARFLCARVNSESDPIPGQPGILEGRWAGADPANYSGGEVPWSWKGSGDILERYRSRGNQTVGYAQCWVFSGVLTTLLRTVGIPARPVTVYQAGKDYNQDGRLTFSPPLDSNGLPVPRSLLNSRYPDYCADSYWNFHVWVDAWIQRQEVGGAFHWNALDSSPRRADRSCKIDAFNVVGPAPVELIKQRMSSTSTGYDVAFLIGEVSPCVEYFPPWRGLSFLLPHIAPLVITKQTLGSFPSDITSEYRNFRTTPLCNDQVIGNDLGDEVLHGELSAPPVLCQGADWLLHASVTNVSSAPIRVRAQLYGALMEYYGEQAENLGLLAEKEMTLFPGESSRIEHAYQTDGARLTFTANRSLEARFVVVDAEANLYCFSSQTRLVMPALHLRREGEDSIPLSATFAVGLSWANPLPFALTNISVTLSTGSGLSIAGASEVKLMLGDLDPGESLSVLTNITTMLVGAHLLSARLSSTQIQDVTGFLLVNVGSTPVLVAHLLPSGVQLVCQVGDGELYCIEYSDDLSLFHWKRLREDAVGDGRSMVLFDEDPPKAQRFYRVRILGP